MAKSGEKILASSGSRILTKNILSSPRKLIWVTLGEKIRTNTGVAMAMAKYAKRARWLQKKVSPCSPYKRLAG
jgi:hypothetical protein